VHVIVYKERFISITNNTGIMAETTISVRVDSTLHEQMKIHEEINWSAIIRQSLSQKLEQLESIDQERARQAANRMDKLRQTRIFNKGKRSEELIREWRDKRK